MDGTCVILCKVVSCIWYSWLWPCPTGAGEEFAGRCGQEECAVSDWESGGGDAHAATE